MLPGMFVMGAAVENKATVDTITAAKQVLESLTTTQVSWAEFKQAMDVIVLENLGQPTDPDSSPNSWLDRDTYRITSDRPTAFLSTSSTDIQRVAAKLFKNAAIATVVVGDIEQLRPIFQGHIQFEVLGEVPTPPPTPTPSPKPPSKPGPNVTPG